MIVFCEYVVMDEHRDRYLRSIMDRLQAAGPAVQVLENTSQPGVFVEIWPATDAEDAARTAQERRDGRSWQEMKQWIKGGEDGLRIWTFRPVTGD